MAEPDLSDNTNVSNNQDKSNEEEEEEDLDTVDGFRKSLKKSFRKLLCTTGDYMQDFTESRPRVRELPNNMSESMASDLEPDTYDFTHQKRGLAVIINNEDFTQSKDFGDRPGSSCDASSLYHSFRDLGFDVLLHHDLPAWKMVEVLKSAIREYDHIKADCFACSILTHGDQTWSTKEWDRMGISTRLDLLFGTDGKALTTKSVVEMFNDTNCPGLAGKPRLFFLQACRGDKYDDGQTVLVKKTIPPGIRPQNENGGGDAKDNGRGQNDNAQGRDDTDSSPRKKSSHSPPATQRQGSLSSSVDPPEYNQPKSASSATVIAVDMSPNSKVSDIDSTDGLADSDYDNDTAGEEASLKRSDRTDAIFWKPTKDIPVSPAPLYKDCLIMYATPPGHFAWRRRTGAWFIQCLCKLFDSNVLEYVSLARGLAYVCGKVAREYQSENPSNPAMHQKKEVPVVESMLIKDIYMSRKKRDFSHGRKH